MTLNATAKKQTIITTFRYIFFKSRHVIAVSKRIRFIKKDAEEFKAKPAFLMLKLRSELKAMESQDQRENTHKGIRVTILFRLLKKR